jgi:ABC-type transport system substrate-binding protein
LTVEGLTQIRKDGSTTPRLAKSLAWSDDGLHLRIELGPGIALHDDRILNGTIAAEALLAAVRNPNNLATHPSLGDVVDVSADGDLSLVVTLSRHNSFVLEDLEVPLRFGGKPAVGTGPYRIVQQEATKVVFERFNKYRGGEPTIPRVVVQPIGTLRNAWTSLLRREVDMVTDVPPANIELISNGGVRLVSFPRQYQFLMAFNTRRPMFASPQVRLAMNLAVDRELLVDRVLHKYGVPSTGPIFPSHWAYDKSVQPFTYNRDEARKLLESAGLRIRESKDPRVPPARLRFTCLIFSDLSVIERLALELKRQLYDVGVDVRFEVVPLTGVDKRLDAGAFDAVLWDAISGPSLGRSYLFWRPTRESRGLNYFGYENAEVEGLFRDLRNSRNDSEVRTITHRLQRAFMSDPPAIFLAWSERTRAIKADIPVTAPPDADPLLTLWHWGSDKQPDSTGRP